MTNILTAVSALIVVPVALKRVRGSVRPLQLAGPSLWPRVSGAILVLMLLAPSLAWAHGKVALEDDICIRRVGGNLVHFNAYQPHHEAKAQYCTDIPGEGDTFWVVDLIDPILRTMPVGVRIVRGLSEAADAQTIAYWPPALHPDGVLRGEAQLAKGVYQLIIVPEGFSPSAYVLRVQQLDYAQVARKALGPLAVLLVLVVLGYEVSKSTRFRRWWGSSRA